MLTRYLDPTNNFICNDNTFFWGEIIDVSQNLTTAVITPCACGGFTRLSTPCESALAYLRLSTPYVQLDQLSAYV